MKIASNEMESYVPLICIIMKHKISIIVIVCSTLIFDTVDCICTLRVDQDQIIIAPKSVIHSLCTAAWLIHMANTGINEKESLMGASLLFKSDIHTNS